MLSFFSSIYEWFVGSLGWIWLAIFFGAVFLALFYKSFSAMAGWDSKWDKEKFDEDHPRSDWNKATTRRYSWFFMAFPYFIFWALTVTALCYFRTWEAYLVVATVWLITAPLRNIWLIAIVRKVDSKRGQKHEGGLWEEVSEYYEEAFRLPGKPSTRPWFNGRLKWLNFFQKFRFIFRIFRFWGILGVIAEMLMSLVWPFFAGAAIFWYLEEAEDYANYRAYWRFDRRRR